MKKYIKSNDTRRLRKVSVDQVLRYFKDVLKWDIDQLSVRNYADAVAEYMTLAQSSDPTYTLDAWYADTKMNYPEELAEFGIAESIRCSTEPLWRYVIYYDGEEFDCSDYGFASYHDAMLQGEAAVDALTDAWDADGAPYDLDLIDVDAESNEKVY